MFQEEWVGSGDGGGVSRKTSGAAARLWGAGEAWISGTGKAVGRPRVGRLCRKTRSGTSSKTSIWILAEAARKEEK